MQARISKRKGGQQGWRWFHAGVGLNREQAAPNRAHWFVLIGLGIGLNVGLTLLASV